MASPLARFSPWPFPLPFPLLLPFPYPFCLHLPGFAAVAAGAASVADPEDTAAPTTITTEPSTADGCAGAAHSTTSAGSCAPSASGSSAAEAPDALRFSSLEARRCKERPRLLCPSFSPAVALRLLGAIGAPLASLALYTREPPILVSVNARRSCFHSTSMKGGTLLGGIPPSSA